MIISVLSLYLFAVFVSCNDRENELREVSLYVVCPKSKCTDFPMDELLT